MNRRTVIVGLTVATMSLVGCVQGGTQVIRTSSGSSEGGDLSGYWNDIDGEQIAENMIDQVMEGGWLREHLRQHGEKPVIKLMGVIKRTDDRNVNEQFFTKQIERVLLNSGRARVVAGYSQSTINRIEREDQQNNASDETVKANRNEVGADYTLQTVINSQNETDGGGQSVRAYLVNMELVHVETQEKVWIGEDKIRKVISQSKTRW